jgi:hypothetical protein
MRPLDADVIMARATPLTHQQAHEIQPFGHLVRMPIVIKEARAMAKRAADAGDDGTNDLLVSDVIRRNELQVWFVAEHVVDASLVRA